MAMKFKDDPRVVFVVGDVRDTERLSRVMTGVDHVVHAAATKIVPTAEYNPSECIKTNINGAMNVIEAAHDQKVTSVVASLRSRRGLMRLQAHMNRQRI